MSGKVNDAPEHFGERPVALRKAAEAVDNRLHRRLHQIEQLHPAEKRQVLQLIDAFIERGQLRRRAGTQTA